MERAQKILEYLQKVQQRYKNLTELIYAPEIIADNRYWRRLNDQRNQIEQLALLCDELDFALSTNSPPSQINELTAKANRLIAAHKASEADAIVEVVAKKSSDRSFCADLIKMYRLFGQKNNIEAVQMGELCILLPRCYQLLKNENGVHKYDDGTAQVVVFMPPSTTQTDFDQNDVRIDLFHSSGAGGQNVNKVQSAVRLTHLPSGVVATCQDSRSQLSNKENAFKELSQRVAQFYKNQAQNQTQNLKQAAIKAGKDKIRVYNYQAGCVNDLKSGITLPLCEVLNGQIEPLIFAHKEENNAH